MNTISTLLVNDNLDESERVLSALGSISERAFGILRAQNLREARYAMRRQSFDLILLSLSLADSHGHDTLVAVRACVPETPLIVLTPHMDPELSAASTQHGAVNCLVHREQEPGSLARSIRMALNNAGFQFVDDTDVALLDRFIDGGNAAGDTPDEEAALRGRMKERALFAAAVSSAKDPVIITDRHSAILYVNPAFARVTGFTAREVLGQNPRILQSGEHDRAFYTEMYRVAAGDGSWSGHLINHKKDGEVFHMDATMTCLRDEAGEIEFYVMVSRDVTDFTELQRQLNQSMRLKAIGQLAGGIAHDFNNVLQVILSYGSFMLDETGSEGDQRLNTYARGICDAARRASDLTRQLLAFGRRQPLHTETVDMNLLVKSATTLVERLIGENIILKLALNPDIPPIHVDPAQIEQIVMNLCVNARDAMPDGGEIAISTTRVELGRDFCRQNAWASPGDYVRLVVRDTGSGMPPHVLEHIFEPFFTTKDESAGTGMGLASVYGIVMQQKGLVHCESAPGKGTALSIYFPAAREEKRRGPGNLSVMDDAGKEQRARILVAEDDQLVAALARTLLEGAGYEVTVAADGQSAFQELRVSTEPYALVLSDVIMPRTTGVELMELVMSTGEIAPKPKFLLCSGYSPQVLERTGALRSSFEFLQKPYSPAELLMRVRKMLSSG